MLTWIAALSPMSALAVPLTMTHTGRLLDATGAPVDGTRDITVSIHDAAGTPFTDTFLNVPVQGGYFSVVLGSGAPLELADFSGADLELGVSVAGLDALRQPLGSVPFAIRAAAVSGDVQVGAAGACAGSADAGRLRWNTDHLEVCDGNVDGWTSVAANGAGNSPSNPALSCRRLLAEAPSTPSGLYWISPEGGAPVETWCDMSTDLRGWTRVAVFKAADLSWCNFDWALARRVAALATGSGGHVLFKTFLGTPNVTPDAAPNAIGRITPGPYGNLLALFTFPRNAESWNHDNATGFSYTVIAGTAMSDRVWWDHGTLGNKAEFCVGSLHQACIYTRNLPSSAGTCGNPYVAGNWRTSNAAVEVYLREP
jgi:hypothetical protein